jgi:hypothetical protein
MAHDVFISYSSKDKPTADATCAVLEAKGIRCWIAPRDIMPGQDWGESIVDAIHCARALVLVFSENANLSQQIKREVERAVNKGIPIIPFRIENVMPAKSLEYFLSTPHWLDAFTPPLEAHLNYLADVLGRILAGEAAPPPPPPPKPGPDLVANLLKLDRRVLVGGGVGGVVALGLLGKWVLSAASPPTFVGKWRLDKFADASVVPSPFGMFSITAFFKAAMLGPNVSGRLQVGDLGEYKYSWSAADAGSVSSSGPGTVAFTSDYSHSSSPFTYMATTPREIGQSVTMLGGKLGDAAIALSSSSGSQSMLVGTPDNAGDEAFAPLVGHWYTDTPANYSIGAVKTSLDIGHDGRYRYAFTISETGLWQAADGKWTRTPQGGMPVTGTYKFDGHDSVSCAASTGVAIFTRDDS